MFDVIHQKITGLIVDEVQSIPFTAALSSATIGLTISTLLMGQWGAIHVTPLVAVIAVVGAIYLGFGLFKTLRDWRALMGHSYPQRDRAFLHACWPSLAIGAIMGGPLFGKMLSSDSWASKAFWLIGLIIVLTLCGWSERTIAHRILH